MMTTDGDAEPGSEELLGSANSAGSQPPDALLGTTATIVGLADMVINGIFRVGLSLHATATLAGDPLRNRLLQATGELDTLIGQVRAAVFASCPPVPPPWVTADTSVGWNDRR